MLATSFMLIVWLMGFLFISTGLEKSQQLHNGELTIYPEKRLAFGVGLVAYIGISLVIAITFVL
ncbi:MAG: hypothetical protein GKR92_02285 [Gammaproteobacteria bacterium]|nr:MAG: hypothetical protein GKR92_02285 [Gammaproteobacteria bacterium]